MSDLRTRASAAAGQEVAERPVQGITLAQQVQRMEQQFAMAAPRGVEAAQLVRDALTCLRTIRNLDRCEPGSVLGALMTAAQLGLRPGVLGHCWPLPFYDGRAKQYKAQFVVGYQGLVDLAHRSGKIASLVGRTVHANDTFEVDYGLDDTIIHKPLLTGDRGPIVAYYTIVKLTTGGHAFEVMSRADAEAHRDRYAPTNREGRVVGPWADHFDAMALKTTVKRLSRWMPKSTDFAAAIEVDGSLRLDSRPDLPAIEASHMPAITTGDDDDTAGEPEPVADMVTGEVIGQPGGAS